MDQDLQVIAVVSEEQFLSAKDVRRTLDLANVSDSTIRRRLRETALRSRIAAQKPLLTCAKKTARLKFAVDHRSWRVDDWKYVIFYDESTLSSRWDQQKRVWRMENTCFSPQNIKDVAASGRTSVNVWAAISRDGLSPLVRISGKFTSAAYCTLLEHEMIPYVLNGPHPDGCYVFLQGLSPVHTAKEVARILDERGVMRLEWCAMGADMNIVEHVWVRMKANLSRLSLDLVTADELWEAMQEEWKRIQADILHPTGLCQKEWKP
ncbi:hypothetical protein HPB50_013138 [Hyalomma asiaticum]|uniref:Uncharacterized protein n=1 Tax=Hyalomma asiaticum TaxID=266040 RepID=A0ACB7RJ22_HYAAI|nr:hypothetical protein HPB50_013138 [Hyalomma asiaticum]